MHKKPHEVKLFSIEDDFAGMLIPESSKITLPILSKEKQESLQKIIETLKEDKKHIGTAGVIEYLWNELQHAESVIANCKRENKRLAKQYLQLVSHMDT